MGISALISFFFIQKKSSLYKSLEQEYAFLKSRFESLIPLPKALEDASVKIHHLEIALEKEKSAHTAQVAALQAAREDMLQRFQALSAQALAQSNQSFLELAKESFSKLHEQSKGELSLKEKSFQALVTPIKESLTQVDQKLQLLEKERENSYSVLRHQVGELITSQKELRSETANLVKALRTPHVRGRWGEMQLRRVVEMSGMSAHCDFTEQTSLETQEGRLRPDMIVRLPGGKVLVIDAKAPLAGYLDALEASDDVTRIEHLRTHAKHVRTHILQLSSRSYWDHISTSETPEFVVLFLPGETFFSAALEQDPSLIEMGVEKKVILATPATLIALLHAVAYGWRQEHLAENAREISLLGKELYKRLSDVGGHIGKLGLDLGRSVRSYNQAVSSLETRVLPSARRFRDLKAVSPEEVFETPVLLESVARVPQALELTVQSEEDAGVKPKKLLKSL